MQVMLRRVHYVGSNGAWRLTLISLPLVEPLLDNDRYFRIEDLAPAAGVTAQREPTLRTLVKTALAYEAAEEKGKAFKHQIDRLGPKQRREKAKVLLEAGFSRSVVARILKVGRSTVHRDLSESARTG
jgi:DNA-directed RNA polymerase specialized sigma24 family protein